MSNLSIKEKSFYRNGEPIQIISGAMHYFRVVPEYWRDRMIKLKAMGLNTLETYVSWNLHEPRTGYFNFSGQLDIVEYVKIAAELGLMVIIRPGPYICSEWDLGGLPSWLLRDPNMRLRCSYPPYLKAVDRFYDSLMAKLEPLQESQGGPIIAMQVENEYGSYGNDKLYLRYLADGIRRRGIKSLLFTADGPCDSMLEGGTLPDIFKIANFGSKPDEAFTKLREHQHDGPMMCGEFWNGWFDHWGEEHHRRDPIDAARDLDSMLAAGASVNFYMFHGGTNFGFMSGANHTGTEYQPDVTSYDFDAILNENGEPTAKYFACREIIGKYVKLPELTLPSPISKRAYGNVQLNECASLLDNLDKLSKPVQRPAPVSMEMLGQDYGFILYHTTIQGPRESSPLILQEVHDRAQIFVDGEYRGVIDRNMKESPINLEFDPGKHEIDILVENMGRVNYGPQLHDHKGITHGVRLGNQFLYGWTIYSLPLTNLKRLLYTDINKSTKPAFYRGTFNVEEPADTFLALPGWTKGVAWINGFNLGRYWEEKGPQHTLYVPAPKLRKGKNEIIILELHNTATTTIEFREAADIG
jgi:beta-galactosidase